MFKAPIKCLHPLLTATQEGNYIGTENISAIPFNGIVLAHCFSDDTELLTKAGWKRHTDIKVGDLLATMNSGTGNMEFQPALRKFEQHYKGPMLHFESHAADHLVTPNHKMMVRTQYSNQWKLIEAGDLNRTGAIVPVAAPNTFEDLPISDDMLRLMVWTVADGNLNGNRIRFHLKKVRKITRLLALLERMGIVHDRRDEDGGTVEIRIDNPGLTKRIPDYYVDLSARQGQIVLEEYSHTDGSRSPTNDGESHAQLSTNVGETADRLQHIAVMSGSKANLCSHARGTYAEQNFLSVRHGITETRFDYARKDDVPYDGTVFCFETANHTLVARRNGKVLFTGNSNEAEWQTFRNNKNNEAFLDRVLLVKVPYCLRATEEARIYEKMLQASELANAPVAPKTFEAMAQFCVLSRLKDHPNSTPWAKMKVYDGENLKETDPRAKSVQEYRDDAGVAEGMEGISTRFAFKVLSAAFNYDGDEIAADPVHLFLVLEGAIRREQFQPDMEKKLLDFIKGTLAPQYAEFIGDEIQMAYLEAYEEYGQNLFDRYIEYADHWIDDLDFKDPDTGALWNRESLNAELEKIEKPAGIANPKDFRQEVSKFVIKQRAKTGKPVLWTSYEKLRRVIEKKMFANVGDLLPVISFGAKATTEDQKKHDDFVGRMVQKGYTPKQVRRIVEWYMRIHKSG